MTPRPLCRRLSTRAVESTHEGRWEGAVVAEPTLDGLTSCALYRVLANSLTDRRVGLRTIMRAIPSPPDSEDDNPPVVDSRSLISRRGVESSKGEGSVQQARPQSPTPRRASRRGHGMVTSPMTAVETIVPIPKGQRSAKTIPDRTIGTTPNTTAVQLQGVQTMRMALRNGHAVATSAARDPSRDVLETTNYTHSIRKGRLKPNVPAVISVKV